MLGYTTTLVLACVLAKTDYYSANAFTPNCKLPCLLLAFFGRRCPVIPSSLDGFVVVTVTL